MRRFVGTVLGLAICTVAIVAFCDAIYELGRIGTCASGGPYVSARPCPPGTGAKIMLIPGALLAAGLGLLLYAWGGMRDRRPKSRVPLSIYLWAFLFLGAAGAISLAAWGPAAPSDQGSGAGIAAIVLLVVFVPMALVPLVGAFLSSSGDDEMQTPVAPRAPSPAVAAAGGYGGRTPSGPIAPAPPIVPTVRPRTATAPKGDVVTRLEHLQSLKASGAITEAEFAQLKAKILADA